MMFKTLSLSAATVALLATGALAQTTAPSTTEPATPPAVTQPAPNTGSATSTTTTTQTQSINFLSSMSQEEMLASELSGLEVRNAAGEDLGDLNDIVMDKAGKPQVAIIGVGGFLGLGEKDVGVPFDALTLAPSSDGKTVARLDVTKEALTAAPNYVYKDSTTASSGGDVKSTGSTGTSTQPAAPRPAQ